MPHSRRLITEQAGQARGFLVQFPPEAQLQLTADAKPSFGSLKIRDLSSWFCSSIDNEESKDLDQIEYAVTEGAATQIYVGIAARPAHFLQSRQPREPNSCGRCRQVYVMALCDIHRDDITIRLFRTIFSSYVLGPSLL